MTRPTPAQQSWAQADHVRRYAETQATRFDLRTRQPIFTCAPERVQPAVSETRVNVYFLIVAAFIFAARYMGVFA
jgi:hypothetical protein